MLKFASGSGDSMGALAQRKYAGSTVPNKMNDKAAKPCKKNGGKKKKG